MNTHDALRASADLSRMVLKSFISDLEDADLMQRPAPACNHLAWQLGHLISSEVMLLQAVKPGAEGVELPEGFAEAHSKEAVGEDDPAKFHTKQEYLDLLDKVYEASLATIASMSESDLDAESPENFRQFAPTVGHVAALIATHPMMHAGQFVPVRRALGKPVLM
ncbi:MAG: DinB family protein [Planctomycetota bacterium]